MTSQHSKSTEKIPVLLLKTKSVPTDGYEELFSRVNEGLYEPVFVPVLEHRFLKEGLDVVRGLLQNRGIGKGDGKKYGGLVFTSQRAVEAFAKLVEEGKGPGDWPYLQDIPIYTVGPATSRALRSIPQTPGLNIFGAETGNGEALAHYMLDHYGEWYKELKIKPSLLFLVGEQRRDIIPKTLMDPALSEERRIHVDESVVYGTGVMESFEQDFTRRLHEMRWRSLRWVVVFSPTGCEAMLRALNMLDSETGKSKPGGETEKKTFIATIGPTTRDYLKTLSINSSLLSPDIQGRIDLSRTFDGSELNTEYLFGLFANIASSPLSLSLIGFPINFQITGFTANGNITAASTIVYFNVTSLGLVVPCEVDTWILWNQYGEIEQYDATFRRFQWMMDYMIEAAAPKLGSNSTTQTVSILTAGLAQSICATAALYCTGSNVQYPDTPTCYNFLTTQIRFGEAYELGPTGGGYCDDSSTYDEVVEQVYFRESFVAIVPGS
ncbi:hypothetical protein B7494_g4078 [Chlorociboria aeruginascens]|nr:hypothetical protein B7494_g4078 [Chlorociboria aeruginascens]